MELFRLLGTVAINGTDEVKSELQTTTGIAQDSESKMTSAFKKIGTAVVTYFAVDKIKSFGSEITNLTADFEDSMLKVQSLSGASTEEYDKLTEAALNYGSTTAWTAKDVANAMGYMALAGFDTNEILASTGGMLNLASASGEELATVTDILTDSMTAFGDGAEDAARYADVLATTQAKSNTTVGLLGEAFKYAAPLAGSYKYKLEDVATALGIMANAGVKGSMAGTSLSSIITRLGTDTDGCRTKLEEMGIEFYNQDGTARDLSLVLKELADATSDYTAEEKAAIAKNIAGQEAQKGLLAILNQGSGAYEALESTIKNCSGTAQNMAENMESGVGGAMRSLDSATEGLKISLGQVFSDDTNGIIRDMAKWISDKLTPKATEFAKKGLAKIKDILSWIDKKMPTIQNITKKTGDILSNIFKKAEPVIEWLIEKALPMFFDMLEFLVENFELVAGVAGTVIGVLKGFSIISKMTDVVKNASGAWEIFNGILASNPIGAVITAVGILAGGIAILVSSMEEEKSVADEVKEQLEKEKQAREEKIQAVEDEMAAIDKKSESELIEIANVENLWKELQTLADESGNVQEKDKARAEFILNELNEALGTEYTMTGNQIQNYKDLKTSIDDAILSKRADILLTTQEEKYKKALNEIQDKQNDLTQQALEYEEAKKYYSKAEAAILPDIEASKRKILDLEKQRNEALDDAARSRIGEEIIQEQNNLKALEDSLEREKAVLESKCKDYEAAQIILEKYYNEIADYENASALILEGNTKEAIKLLDSKGQAYITAAELAKEESETQLEILKDQMDKAKVTVEELEKLVNNADEKNRAIYERQLETAKEHLKACEEEFLKAGGSVTNSFSRGVDSGKFKLTNSVKGALNEAYGEAHVYEDKFVGVGENIAEGIASGIAKGSSSAGASVSGMINGILKQAKDVAMIKSPSRLFAKEVGAYIPPGVGMGIEDNMDAAIDPMRDMIGRMSNVANGDVINNYNSSYSSPVINDNSAIEGKINQLIDVIKNLKIYLNGDVLVGELAPAMDSALGNIAIASERGQ